MKITVDISMYPLAEDYKPLIKDFIKSLRTFTGLTVLSNQMSTQINGEFELVTRALNESMHTVMAGPQKVVFVTRYLNADLAIGAEPDID